MKVEFVNDTPKKKVIDIVYSLHDWLRVNEKIRYSISSLVIRKENKSFSKW